MNIKIIEWVVNTPEIGKRTHTKKSTVLTKIVLRGHPGHYQQCYDGILTCNVNKVYMILLISIYVFLISIGIFPQLSTKESYFLHNEKDIINIRYYCLLCYACVWYSIPNIETLFQICSLTTVAKAWKLLHLDGNNNCWSYLM